jgi:hypothetical protein
MAPGADDVFGPGHEEAPCWWDAARWESTPEADPPRQRDAAVIRPAEILVAYRGQARGGGPPASAFCPQQLPPRPAESGRAPALLPPAPSLGKSRERRCPRRDSTRVSELTIRGPGPGWASTWGAEQREADGRSRVMVGVRPVTSGSRQSCGYGRMYVRV